MKRRLFIVGFASVIAAWPLELRAQKSPAVVGFLGGQATPAPKDAQGNALLDGFRNNGLIAGRDFIFETRFSGGDDERFPELARELARLKARVILANTPAGVRAAQKLEPPIPVLMTLMNDPVGAGLISSLAHPGNHTSGTASLNEDVTPKVLEFVREVYPHANRIAILYNPLNSTHAPILEDLKARSGLVGVTLIPSPLKPLDNVDALFAKLAADRIDAVELLGDPAIGDLRDRLAALALAQRIPLFSTSSIVTEAGALLSYGAPINKLLSRMGYYVKRVLDGADPSDLPVEQPTEVILVINLKTANALGAKVPPALLSRADRVIE
jgi:putative tryptophan/tyrosine transport system substrate-binding protein